VLYRTELYRTVPLRRYYDCRLRVPLRAASCQETVNPVARFQAFSQATNETSTRGGAWSYLSSYEDTNDAQIDGHIIAVSSRINEKPPPAPRTRILIFFLSFSPLLSGLGKGCRA
jgi:hypothetical protein